MKKFADIYLETIYNRGGIVVIDQELDGHRYLSSIFADLEASISKKDKVAGGIGLYLSPDQATLSAYNLRFVCDNGMMSGQNADEYTFEAYEDARFEENLHRIYESLPTELSRAVSSFCDSQQQIPPRDFVIYLVHALNFIHRRDDWHRRLLEQARIEQMRKAELSQPQINWRRRRRRNRHSRFELINAVTAMAREERHPRVRWQMEQLAGKLLEECRTAIRKRKYADLEVFI